MKQLFQTLLLSLSMMLMVNVTFGVSYEKANTTQEKYVSVENDVDLQVSVLESLHKDVHTLNQGLNIKMETEIETPFVYSQSNI